jgi:hypothetical protein
VKKSPNRSAQSLPTPEEADLFLQKYRGQGVRLRPLTGSTIVLEFGMGAHLSWDDPLLPRGAFLSPIYGLRPDPVRALRPYYEAMVRKSSTVAATPCRSGGL